MSDNIIDFAKATSRFSKKPQQELPYWVSISVNAADVTLRFATLEEVERCKSSIETNGIYVICDSHRYLIRN